MSNYPDSVTANDIDGLFDQARPFAVYVEVQVFEATSQQDAVNTVIAQLGTGDHFEIESIEAEELENEDR